SSVFGMVRSQERGLEHHRSAFVSFSFACHVLRLAGAGLGPKRTRPFMTIKAAVTGWGTYSPPKILTNQDLEAALATSDAWIRSRAGIRERHVAGPEETTSSM